jgi:peptidylprolyl isomerase
VPGVQADVKYVGVLYEDGSEFDSSWSRSPGRDAALRGRRAGIIPGFDQGVTGMQVGRPPPDRHPSDLAYGPAGQGRSRPRTLVFVIDLIEVTPAAAPAP